MQVSGIVHGKTIELQEDLGLPDGEAVKVIVRQVLRRGKAFGVLQVRGRMAAKNWTAGLNKFIEAGGGFDRSRNNPDFFGP